MRLTVLGCSGSVPGPDSPASGYLVQGGGTSVVLDLGNGTLGAMQRVLDPFDLDGVVLSHLHPDHCADVPSLIVYLRYNPASRRRDALPLHGPSATLERIRAAYATDVDDRLVTDLSDVLDFRPMDEAFCLGALEVGAVPVDHLCEAYGLRVRHGGRVLAFSGDTGPCVGLDTLAAGADVLLVEASWPHGDDRPSGVHLSGQQAGEAAARGGVGRLLLTHVPPWTEPQQMLAEARSAYCGPIELVHAGACYEV
ncbi:MAG: MBL fold metallo-hydrolase [Actinomycetota bacterium]|nr:MBL fold metallo-hydrolase [Actinomycetota bacterium]